MRNLIVLSFTLLAVCTLILFFGTGAKSIKKAPKDDLVGTWQICNKQTGKVDTCYAGHCGLIRYKIITASTFMNVDIIPGKKLIYGSFSGDYDVKNDVYTESIELAGPGYSPYLGQKNDFKIRIEDDVFYITGINNHYDEMWRKVKE